MPYFKTCTECGANLDPQERCDCQVSTMHTSVIPLTGDGAASSQANMLDAYEQHLTDIGMRPNTVSTYLAEVKRLSKYLLRTCGLDISKCSGLISVTSHHLSNYHGACVAGSHKQKTRNLYMIAIKSFFGFHHSTGNTCGDPSESLPRQRRRHEEMEDKLDENKFYTQEVIGAVIGFLREQMQNNCKKRDLALFALLCASAMRINEACSLNIGDMQSLIDGWVYVVGKGGQRERVTVASFAAPYLERYLQSRSDASPDEPLFLSQKGGRLTENAAWKAFARFQKPLGIPTGTHICRHTALTHIAHDAGVLVARDAARHKDVKTTNTYIHRMHDRVAQAAENTPVAETFANAQNSA